MAPRPRPASSAEPERAQRADARRNRDRLVVAATRVFEEKGADASLDDVARRAEVGIGTLYRHFPTREALLAAACDERLLSLAAESRDAKSPPLEALRWFLEQIAEQGGMYRGLAASFGVLLQSHSPGCDATTSEGRRLVEAAQHAGAIRKDVALDDLLAMATAISVAAAQDGTDPGRARRLVGMLLDGLVAMPVTKPAREAKPVRVAKRRRR